MDSAQTVEVIAKTSDTILSLEDEQEIVASTVGQTVVVDPSSSSVTHMDVKAKQASEHTDLSSTSDNVNIDENVSDILDVPNVQLTKESNAETEHGKNYLSISQEADNTLLDTIVIQDAFIFCPMMEPIVLNETLAQGIFASEREMSDLVEVKILYPIISSILILI